VWRISISIKLTDYFLFKKVFYVQTQEDLSAFLAQKFPHYVIIDIEPVDNFSNYLGIMDIISAPLQIASCLFDEHIKKCSAHYALKAEVEK
jgi:hypothetical protein